MDGWQGQNRCAQGMGAMARTEMVGGEIQYDVTGNRTLCPWGYTVHAITHPDGKLLNPCVRCGIISTVSGKDALMLSNHVPISRGVSRASVYYQIRRTSTAGALYTYDSRKRDDVPTDVSSCTLDTCSHMQQQTLFPHPQSAHRSTYNDSPAAADTVDADHPKVAAEAEATAPYSAPGNPETETAAQKTAAEDASFLSYYLVTLQEIQDFATFQCNSRNFSAQTAKETRLSSHH